MCGSVPFQVTVGAKGGQLIWTEPRNAQPLRSLPSITHISDMSQAVKCFHYSLKHLSGFWRAREAGRRPPERALPDPFLAPGPGGRAARPSRQRDERDGVTADSLTRGGHRRFASRAAGTGAKTRRSVRRPHDEMKT
ncbi:hypothetical protein SKAU_G00381800 [Synaphobranchus kaupii]|uniref:Uncharacterized protein n=1 Tax=Synaphobranchus kaupii TaxID=118154 RepID=A0A9Q1IDW9_SYNKA|nr:hypothetical protein SKAU_G00381800 [Synaphobranchus kaupii]